MREDLEGIGQLEKWENPDGQDDVSYHFTITADIVERPGFPRVKTNWRGQGTVKSTAGRVFPEGSYRLYCENETLKVENLGMGIWTIEGSRT